MIGRTVPTHIAVLLAAVIGLLACGGPTSQRPKTKAEQAAAVPFTGREAKQVAAALPDDARDILEQAEHTTLYTLNPHRLRDGVLSAEKERFRHYGVLGKAEITKDEARRKLVEAVYRGLKGEGAGPANCFNPRHSLRFEKDGKTVDILICFECTWVHVFAPGAKHELRMLFGPGVRPVFDSAVKSHRLLQDGAR